MLLPRLDTHPDAPFPPADAARTEPNGLLAYGGDLSPNRLMNAYRAGIFPWYSRNDPILWWSPDPRTVFGTDALHLSRRTRKDFRRSSWTISADRRFSAVVSACATTPRPGQAGTWILPEMQLAYENLHRLGHAHSVEIWSADRLVGGVYGVLAGPVFCGESMFSHESGASKLALAALCRLLFRHGVRWLDAQMSTPHLMSLGAMELARSRYLQLLRAKGSDALTHGDWGKLVEGWQAADFS